MIYTELLHLLVNTTDILAKAVNSKGPWMIAYMDDIQNILGAIAMLPVVSDPIFSALRKGQSAREIAENYYMELGRFARDILDNCKFGAMPLAV